MNYFKYFIYGIVQGFTEFLPISSTAHIKIVSEIFSVEDPGSSLSAIVQIGSVLSLLVFFKNDIRHLFRTNLNISSLTKNKIIRSVFIGTISIIIFGIFIKFGIPKFYESILRSNLLIGFVSIFTGLLMYLSDISKSKNISLLNHSLINSFFIGLAQSFAIIPGVSRSGITISSALLLGWNREDAAKYSLLLGIPAISIAAFVEIYSSFNNNLLDYSFPLLISLITAFISSLISIKILIKYVTVKGLKIFVFYKIFFGLIILIGEFDMFRFS